MTEHHHPEQFETFIKDLILMWNDYLTYVKATIRHNSDSTQIKPRLIHTSIEPLEYPRYTPSKISKIHLKMINADMAEEYHRVFNEVLIRSDQHVCVMYEAGYRQWHPYFTSIHSQAMSDLLTDISVTTQFLQNQRFEWQSAKHSRIDAFDKKYSTELMYTQFNLDLGYLYQIVYDNIKTVAQVIKLFSGDTRQAQPQQILTVLNDLIYSKPSTSIHPRYPSLTLSALLGKIQFGVLSTLDSYGYVVNQQTSRSLEAIIKDLMLIPPPEHSKELHGCPAIPIIPESFELFLEVMSRLFPEKYIQDPTGRMYLLERNLRTSNN